MGLCFESVRRCKCFCVVAVVAFCVSLSASVPAQQNVPTVTDTWKALVEKNAPEEPTAQPTTGQLRRVLVFSLFTGFNHTVIPNVDAVFEILGKKSGTFQATISRDIEVLTAENLAKFDVLVLNNNCSIGPRRNLLLDELERNSKYQGLSETERAAKSSALEQALLDFVRNGKGLVVIHGAPTLLNNSLEFTEMVGGAFDYHPKSQDVTIRPVVANHPLVAAFRGKSYVHRDEPYCFKGAYEKKNFLPLLVIDAERVDDGPRGRFKNDVRYTAWIKRCGKGRVFYCSPGHYPETYESPIILQFLLDGTQYAAGDLPCDDQPLGGTKPGKANDDTSASRN